MRSVDLADPLGEALHVLRMQGTFYSRCECSAPWGLDLPAMPNRLMMHVVTSGHCWLEVAGEELRLLQPGDLALVPHGEGHRLASAPGIPGVGLWGSDRVQLSDRYETIRIAGGGEAASLVCTTVRFDHPAARHLIQHLPRVISVNSWRSPEMEWIPSTLRFMAGEARNPRPGGETVITRLADILVIQAIRSWIEQDPAARTGWLGALRDRQIGHAIAQIHRDPARDWSVASLATEAAMSRSAFAARFTALAGETPMQYVTRWRMQIALTWLQEEEATLGELALRLGYGSEAAFSRAFKRFSGISPGAVRRGVEESRSRGVEKETARRLDGQTASRGGQSANSQQPIANSQRPTANPLTTFPVNATLGVWRALRSLPIPRPRWSPWSRCAASCWPS